MCYNSTILRKEGVRMGFTEETVRFKLDDSNKKEISETLTDVYASLLNVFHHQYSFLH